MNTSEGKQSRHAAADEPPLSKQARERRWIEENREAIESWNEHIEPYGLPLERHRQF